MLWWKYQQLRMGNEKSRLAVVEKLAAAGDDRAVGPLVFALKDKEPTVRCAAAKALIHYPDRRAVDPLIQMLRDSTPLARAAAAETLGHMGDPVAVNHLVGFLRDADPIVRTIAARSLDRLGWKPGSDSHRVLQILAMGTLNQLINLGPEGVGPLLELLRSGPPNKQFAAVKALAEFNDPRIRPAMVEALQKPSPSVRIAALSHLERMADPAAFHAIEKLLYDPNASVRGAAVEAAARCGGLQAVPALMRSLRDQSWEVRLSAVKALANLGDPTAVDGLCKLIIDPDRDVREAAITGLAQIGDRRAILPLIIGLLDPENSVRSLALATLQRFDRRWDQVDGLHEIFPRIVAALNHQDYWVRYSAGKLVEQLKIDVAQVEADTAAGITRPATPAQHPALGILADLLFDRDRDLRLAAALAFVEIRDQTSAGLLSAALRDDDVAVREAAQSALAALN